MDQPKKFSPPPPRPFIQKPQTGEEAPVSTATPQQPEQPAMEASRPATQQPLQKQAKASKMSKSKILFLVAGIVCFVGAIVCGYFLIIR